MNIIRESYEILNKPNPQNCLGVLQHLERVGRTCYKSEDKITEQSCLRFLERIRDRGHWAVLEHYMFVLSVPEWIYNDLMSIYIRATDHELIDKMRYIESTKMGDQFIVSFSATALNYVMQHMIDHAPVKSISTIGKFMLSYYTDLLVAPPHVKFELENIEGIKFVSNKNVDEFDVDNKKVHETMSVRFTIPRSISHEIVRHRPASYAQESTRYVKYNSNMTFVFPTEFIDDEDNADIWIRSMRYLEKAYKKMIANGASAQQAASVLPNSLKTELVMTARLSEWYHFFDMRADRAAHPQMREVAVPLLADAIVKYPGIFDSLRHRLKENEEYVYPSQKRTIV